MILAIDPGENHCGAALFSAEGQLVRATLVKRPGTADGLQGAINLAGQISYEFPHARTVIIEQQVILMRGQTRGKDPNDLLRLAEVVGAIGSRYYYGAAVFGVRPSEWKGQVDADVMTRRIESHLQAEELPRIAGVIPSLRHNVIDAVGLGLWWLKKKGIR